MSMDLEMMRAICKVGRRALAQDESTPEHERLSVRALFEQAIVEMERGLVVDEPPVVKVEPVSPEPLVTPALPGSHYAGAARKNGSEDEYENQMEARYGGKW